MSHKRVSDVPTPWAIHCGGLIEGHECNNGRPWQCPYCRAEAWWDDAIYAEHIEMSEGSA